jgi:uncharacterized membrane protein (UPF0127 family)
MKAKIKYKGKSIEIPDIKEANGIKKFIGLMFKSKKTDALLFTFGRETRQAIHSFFCKDFLAIWLDKRGKVLQYKMVTPNQPFIKPSENFSKLLEIPLNNKYKKIIRFFLEERKI